MGEGRGTSFRALARMHAGGGGEPRYEPRAVAAIVFLLSSAGLIFSSLPLEGYLRSSWRVPFVLAGLICLTLAALTIRVGFLSVARTLVIIGFADVAITMSAFSVTDRVGGQVIGALLVLPTLFLAIFMSWRWLVGQSLVTVGCAFTIIGLADAPPGVHLVRTLILLTSAAAPALVVLILRSQLDRALGEARQLATTDPLTGLLNRRGLDLAFPGMAARAGREGLTIGVLVCDLDHFKRVNDELGHAAGDEVLRTIAEAARSCTRTEDLVARLGGEEMAIVTVGDMSHVSRLAERVRHHVQRSGRTWAVTVSIGGICLLPTPTLTLPSDVQALWSLVDAADDLMYRAKGAGRNRAYVEQYEVA